MPASPEGLRVDVATLRRRGVDRHRIAVDLPAAWLLAVLEGTDAEVRDAGHVELEILLPTEGAVIASGRLKVGFEVPCGRCLEPAAVDGSTDLSATFVVGSAVPVTGPAGHDDDDEEEGLGLEDDDLDTWLYDGTTVVFDDLIAEYVKLAYPMRALCRRGEACRGLCSNCGADLNEQPGLATQAGICTACGRPVGPVVGDPEGAETAEPEAEGPLAAALKKLQLPD